MPTRKRGHAVQTGAQRWLNRRYGDSDLPTAPIDIDFTDATVGAGAADTVVVADADALSTPYAVGSKIEYGGDGVVRTVTSVDTGTNTVQFAPALAAASAAGVAVEHYGFGIPEAHFDPIAVTGIQLWLGKRNLPVWEVPQAAGGGPPTAVSLDLGDAVQFRVAVYDRNGKGRWTSIAQLLTARPEFVFNFTVGAGLTADASIGGLFKATAVGAPTVLATLTLNGVNYDSQTVTVTIT